MQKEHRDIIQKNFSSLVERTDLELMVASLYEKGVFSQAMIEPYKDTSKDVRARKRQLYMDVTRRGPEAFRHLLDALSESGYWDLVRELDPASTLHTARPHHSSGGGENSFLSLSSMKKHIGKEDKDPNRNAAKNKNLSHSGRWVEGNISKEKETNNASAPEASSASASGGHELSPAPFKVVLSTKFFHDNENSAIRLYPSRGRYRGALLLFTYISYKNNMEAERRGATVDAHNLQSLFAQIGFKVVPYDNLTYSATMSRLHELQQGYLEGRPDCVFVVFSAHGYYRAGTGDNDIRCSDGKLLSLHEIIRRFNNREFPALRGVPKVFIFQTCRGMDDESVNPPAPLGPAPATDGVPDTHHRPLSAPSTPECAPSPPETDGAHPSPASPWRGPLYSDILIAHSTVPGCVSHRDPALGSWYLQALCVVFAARAHDTHVEKLLTLVDERLRAQYDVQTSSRDSWGFNRRLYLHPGLFEPGS